jgi:hypothetical protein
MATGILPRDRRFSTEEMLLTVLRTQGPQTLDNLCSLPEIGSSQMLLAIDRLSRSGLVSIEPIARCEYRVVLNDGAAC